eukprot:m.25027 g.25027  ORF g.25027 m.25027 type:complete len:321 (+) comp8816_c0_seq1:139-1101(+)
MRVMEQVFGRLGEKTIDGRSEIAGQACQSKRDPHGVRSCLEKILNAFGQIAPTQLKAKERGRVGGEGTDHDWGPAAKEPLEDTILGQNLPRRRQCRPCSLAGILHTFHRVCWHHRRPAHTAGQPASNKDLGGGELVAGAAAALLKDATEKFIRREEDKVKRHLARNKRHKSTKQALNPALRHHSAATLDGIPICRVAQHRALDHFKGAGKNALEEPCCCSHASQRGDGEGPRWIILHAHNRVFNRLVCSKDQRVFHHGRGQRGSGRHIKSAHAFFLESVCDAVPNTPKFPHLVCLNLHLDGIQWVPSIRLAHARKAPTDG